MIYADLESILENNGNNIISMIEESKYCSNVMKKTFSKKTCND